MSSRASASATAAASAGPTGSASAEVEQSALLEQIEPLRNGGRNLIAEPPGEREEPEYRAWVAAAARAARDGLTPPGAPSGFTLRVLQGHGIWLLSEDDTKRRGAGALVLRVGAAAPLLVEAPHTFFDQGTLPLALAVFTAQRARALLINTSHRYGGRPKPGAAAQEDPETDEVMPEANARPDAARDTAAAPIAFADVAHAERSFFLSAHRGLLESLPGLPTLQLHGFQDNSAPGVAAILSAVGRGAALDRVLDALRAALPGAKVLAYPAEINKLGGASNQQSHASRKAGAPFYHLEMSRSLRDQLVDDANLRGQFAAAFSGAAAPEGARPPAAAR